VKITIAAVQAEVQPTLALGLERTHELARKAATSGATLVVFPETWLPGDPIWLDVCRDVALWDSDAVKTVFARHAAESVDVDGESGRALARIANELGITLVTGVVERRTGGPGHHTLYNSLLVYGPDGTLRNHHRKLMPTYTERMLWGQGDANGLRAVALDGAPSARIGGLICWEHWMPLARQALHDSGEDIHVALWPTAHEMHQIASRHYAFEARCFVVASGSLMRAKHLPPELEPHPERVTSPDQYVLRGGTAIIAPNGAYVAEPVYERDTIVTAELDLDMCRREAMTLDAGGHYARPDCFEFEVKGFRL
jgi:nitrilase